MDLCMLIPAIATIIGAILGYLLGKATSKGNNENSKEIEGWKSKYAALEADLDECKKQSSSTTSKKSGSSNKATTPVVESSLASKTEVKTPTPEPKVEETPTAPITASEFNADLAKSVFGKKIKQDDLRIVEGVGPKIAELFINNGVKTWKDLSECSTEKCQEILASGGDRYKMHNPGTWPKQALLAHEGKWQQLADWQNSLDGGK